MDIYRVKRAGPVVGSIRPPGSKSITNRALVCAALARGASRLQNVLDSEDTRVMVQCLQRMGISIAGDNPGGHDRTAAGARSFERSAGSPDGAGALATELVIEGCDGQLTFGDLELYAENSGTTLRFLTAVSALGTGRVTIDGNARMRQRPVLDLVVALRALGVSCACVEATGAPPVQLKASGLQGGRAVIQGSLSSQFLSALLMTAPYARRPVTLVVEGELVSVPYVKMTLQVMSAFGVNVPHVDFREFHATPGHYVGTGYEVEPDASAASYFWAAAAITSGDVLVRGLHADALQGDVGFCQALQRMGCQVSHTPEGTAVRGGPLVGIEVDMRDISDTVPTLAVVALFANGPTTICNVRHIRHKESDRIRDLARELRKVGATVVEREDGLTIVPATLHGARLATYDDHRMAMSLSLIGLRVPGIEIENPGCTQKTFPGYFQQLETLCGA